MRALRIVTEPFVFLNINEVYCEEELNEHGKLKIRGLIEKENVEPYKKLACQELWVNVQMEDEAESVHPFFHGVLTTFRIRTDGDVHELTIELKTGTYLMDLIPHIRSFQDETITYNSILDTCADGSFIMRKGEHSPIGEFMLQYEETDWQFIKRLASHLNAFLLPEYEIAGKKLYFGMKESAKQENLIYDTYTEEINSFGISFLLESRDLYKTGQLVLFQNGSYIVGKRISRFIGEEVCHEYHLLSKNLWKHERKENTNIQGLSLKATVLQVKNDKVQVEISQDENKNNSGKRWFTYATVYSTPDGTGWYCMPEIGDQVRLTFPDDREASAYVASSVHLEASGGRTNPNEKSWKNRYQKEVLLTPSSIKIRNNAGLSVELLDESGIDIISNRDINLKSERDIKLTSQSGEVYVMGKAGVSLNQNGASIRIADEVKITGGKIYMN